jgi:alcohol dehydrogenase class IV
MEANIRAMQDGPLGAATLPRYAEVARILTGNPSARAQDGVERVQALCTELKIPPLREAGLTVAESSRIIPTAQRASSMQGNPVRLSDEELLGILENAI